jgi:hypothetical protein
MANEYIFFDESLRDRFMAFAADVGGIESRTWQDRIEGWIVALPGEIAPGVQAAIEAEYDALMDRQREMADASDGVDAKDLMGVTVTLPNGSPCVVRLPAAFARRLVEHFTFEEIHQLVSGIAVNVANPSNGPICRDI